MNGAGYDAADARDQVRLFPDGHDAGGGADDVDDVSEADSRADRVPMGIERADRDRDARR